MLGKRFDGCFAGVVGCIAGWIGDALLAARDDDCARIARLEAWNVGIEAIDDTAEVGVQDLTKHVGKSPLKGQHHDVHDSYA